MLAKRHIFYICRLGGIQLKEDRRIRKTKTAIHNALINLLQDNSIDRITIKSLTEEADIHRATFYVHYQDIYELYEEIQNNTIHDLSSLLLENINHSNQELFTILINYVWDNKNICHMCYGPSFDPHFLNRVSAVLETCYLNIWLQVDHLSEITDEMRFLTTYNIHGCHAIISRWFESDFVLSKDDIITLLYKVNENFEQLT